MGAHCLPARIPCAEIAPAPSLLPYHYFTREYIIQVGEMGWWWTGREGINKASKKEARVVWRSCLRAREIAAGGGGGGTACNIFLGSTEFTDNIPAQAKVVEQHGIDLKCAWQKVERPWITNAC